MIMQEHTKMSLILRGKAEGDMQNTLKLQICKHKNQKKMWKMC